MRHRIEYEEDDTYFSADAYKVKGHGGVAWYVLGWETEPGETEWGTGRVVAIMIGDDHRWVFDEDELIPIEREEYCGVCGQLGCCHDGLPREED